MFVLAAQCGTTLPCLDEGTYMLTSQFVIDHFQAVFSGCHDIVCNVYISGDDITNLDSLAAITSIQGNLQIYNNANLASLAGLESLTCLGGYLDISNNTALNSISGLEGLTTIGGYLRFSHNTELTSLSGLGEGISIWGGLTIYSNSLLSQCEVEAICSYLINPSGVILISNNAPGCDSEEEVEAACLVGVEESAVSGQRSAVRVFPNPTYEIVHIEFEIENPSPVSIMIFNVMGEKVADLSDGILAKRLHQITWNAADLPAGMYFYQLRTKGVEQVVAGKIMKR